jgi:hypothetical protein
LRPAGDRSTLDGLRHIFVTIATAASAPGTSLAAPAETAPVIYMVAAAVAAPRRLCSLIGAWRHSNLACTRRPSL